MARDDQYSGEDAQTDPHATFDIRSRGRFLPHSWASAGRTSPIGGVHNCVRPFSVLVALLAGCSSTPLTARPEYCQEQPATSPVTVQGPTAAELARCGAVPRRPGEDVYGFVIDGACRYTVHVPSQCGPGRCTLRMVAMDGSDSWIGPCSAVKAGDFIVSAARRRVLDGSA